MNKQTEALKLALEAAYLAGFSASGEGYNGEYPFQDHNAHPVQDKGWCERRDKYIREALAEQPAQQEIEELTAQRDKLADILTRTANALKGQPAELSSHSWHDLPEVAQQIKAAQQQEPVAYASDVEFDDETEIIPAEQKGKLGTAGLRIPLYIDPPTSKPWVGLTDEEIEAAMPSGIYDCLADPWDCGVGDGNEMRSVKKDVLRIARAIEAKLREKNNG